MMVAPPAPLRSPDAMSSGRELPRSEVFLYCAGDVGVTVVSGLAKGVDSAAHFGAMDNGGRTVAVIGTSLAKAYPAENADLQESIYRRHLSKRNRTVP